MQGSLRSNLSFMVALSKMSLKAAMALRGAFAMQVLFMALNNLTFFVFWWVLLAKVPHVRGWTIADVSLLYGVVAAGFGLGVAVAGGATQLGRYVEQGELDSFLTQPKAPLIYALGSRSQASGIGDLLSGLFLIAWSGDVGVARAPWIALSVLLSSLVFVASATLFFSIAFWVGRADSLSRQLYDATITFSLYPEPLFGGALKLVLFTVVPAGFVGYLPVSLIRNPSLERLLVACGGAMVYVCAARWVFYRGLRRYASGSRFGVFG